MHLQRNSKEQWSCLAQAGTAAAAPNLTGSANASCGMYVGIGCSCTDGNAALHRRKAQAGSTIGGSCTKAHPGTSHGKTLVPGPWPPLAYCAMQCAVFVSSHDMMMSQMMATAEAKPPNFDHDADRRKVSTEVPCRMLQPCKDWQDLPWLNLKGIEQRESYAGRDLEEVLWVKQPRVNLGRSLVAQAHDKNLRRSITRCRRLSGLHFVKQLAEGVQQGTVVLRPVQAEMTSCAAEGSRKRHCRPADSSEAR